MNVNPKVNLELNCDHFMFAPARYVVETIFTYVSASNAIDSVNILYSPKKYKGFDGIWIRISDDALKYFSNPIVLPKFTKCSVGGVMLDLPFHCGGEESLLCNYDVIAICFFYLSQYHEYKPKRESNHFRTEFKDSIFNGLLSIDQPVITLLINDLFKKSIYRDSLNVNNLYNSNFQIALTHDVDFIPLNRWHGFLRAFKNITIEVILRKKILSSIAMFFRLIWRFISFKPILDNIISLTHKEMALNLRSCFLFVPNGKHRKDPVYTLDDTKLNEIFKWLIKNDFEIGVHYSYASGANVGQIINECSLLSNLVGTVTTGRQHYLNLQLPFFYSDLQQTNINCDMSIAYTPVVGYKTGFDRPHRSWDFDNWKPSSVINLPLLYFDTTFSDMPDSDVAKCIDKFLDQNSNLGSTVSLLWHDSQFDDLQTSSMKKFFFDLIHCANLLGCDFKLPRDITKQFLHAESKLSIKAIN